MSTIPASPRRARSRDLTEQQFDRLLGYSSRIAVLFIGIVVAVVAMQATRVVLMPVVLAIIIGLMFGPIADRLEARGLPSALSAGIIVLLFILLIMGGITAFAVPLSEWVARGPEIWAKLQDILADWQQPLQALAGIDAQIKGLFSGGGGAMAVTVEEGSPIADAALMAPAILTEVLIFLISLFFYLATRDQIRMSILAMCATRRMRWRTAHVFDDVETRVSRFLLLVTCINAGVGVAVGLMTWALGLPSPLLWGAMAFVLNYIPYVGQAVILVVLLAVGFATQDGLVAALLPAIGYGAINFIEGNMLFPAVVGRGMTLNPFLVFLSISFAIFVWGPFGALVAVPMLLIVTSFLRHVIPTQPVAPTRPVRRTARMTDRDLILANAAAAIREKTERARAEAAAAEAKAAEARASASSAARAIEEVAEASAAAPAPRPRRPRKTVPPKPA